MYICSLESLFLGGNLSFISLKQGTVIERHQSG